MVQSNQILFKSKQFFTEVIHMEPNEIGAKIGYGRKEKGLTLDEVAVKCGTTRQNIRRIESGNFVRPDYNLILKIFDYLSIDTTGLLTTDPILSETKADSKSVDKLLQKISLLEAKNSLLEAKNSEVVEKYIALLEKLAEGGGKEK